jgi:hypothetical protein
MWKTIFAAVCVTIVAQSPARALCSGASVAQEFREADVVVNARMVSQTNSWTDEPSAAYLARWGTGGPVLLYGLRVQEVFKGTPGPRIRFFEEQNSGAFYLDVDKDYLLFLNYYRPSPDRPTEARGSMYVRYACGQSKLLSQVRPGDLAEIRALSARQ